MAGLEHEEPDLPTYEKNYEGDLGWVCLHGFIFKLCAIMHTVLL